MSEIAQEYNVGDRVNTPDGVGTVACTEKFENGPYRIGVLHDEYPVKRCIGLYRNNVLYYYEREVTKEVA